MVVGRHQTGFIEQAQVAADSGPGDRVLRRQVDDALRPISKTGKDRASHGIGKGAVHTHT